MEYKIQTPLLDLNILENQRPFYKVSFLKYLAL